MPSMAIEGPDSTPFFLFFLVFLNGRGGGHVVFCREALVLVGGGKLTVIYRDGAIFFSFMN